MSHPDYKSDPKIGQKVKAHLESICLETPMTDRVNDKTENKIIAIETHMREVLKTLGLDLTDDSLMDTPSRIAKMLSLIHI